MHFWNYCPYLAYFTTQQITTYLSKKFRFVFVNDSERGFKRCLPSNIHQHKYDEYPTTNRMQTMRTLLVADLSDLC